MTPFEAYKTYSALKLHFTTDYNYFQYNGSVRLKQESFEKRNDKVFFANSGAEATTVGRTPARTASNVPRRRSAAIRSASS